MDLMPSIDLLDGRVVRLLRGDFDQCKVYAQSALALADQYHREGANWLHVVDLAAARDGNQADTTALFGLLRGAGQAVQTGGGVRDAGDIQRRLNAGARRVVVGSLCVTEPALFGLWLEEFGPQSLVAALDVKLDGDGVPWPRIHGWTGSGRQSLWELLDQLSADGLSHLLCTDIDRDGALRGPNLGLYRDIAKRYPDLQLQASGGVSDLMDIGRLQQVGAAAVITGKALLENRFTIREALQSIL